MSGATIPFRKMNGLGNAFLVFDARQGPVTCRSRRSASSAARTASASTR